MVAELSKALSQIGAVLPRVEVQLNLYRTDSMKAQVELLYSEIIHFYQRAMKWYEGGKFKHILGAFANPYSLRFKDLRDKIEQCSLIIEKEAAVYAQVEIRNVALLTQSNFRSNKDNIDLLLDLRSDIISQ
jgi:hypothetical protein